MKKVVAFLALGVMMYSSTAFASESRLYLSSGDRQVGMTYEAPSISDDELNEAINRLTSNTIATDLSIFAPQASTTPTSYSSQTSQPLSSAAAPYLAANAAVRAAHGRSVGRCALYVRRALQSAGYSFTPQASAYQYANGTLASAGFKKLDNATYKPQVGDIAVFNRTSRNPHGHIQIYDGSQWVSDFVQPKFSPYSQHEGYTVWRDSRYMDASNQGIYLAFNE